jgi:hypothetical protein
MLLFMFWFNMVSLEEQLVPLNKVWGTGSSISGCGDILNMLRLTLVAAPACA